MHERNAIVVVAHGNDDEFSATTVLKPMSEEYLNYLYVICEDAYGEFSGGLVQKPVLQERLQYSDDEFELLLKKLDVSRNIIST
jgi:hypothetical protein